MTVRAGDVERLNADLARAYQRLADLSRELADEQALTRRLRGVIALLPYNAVRRPHLCRKPVRRAVLQLRRR